MEDKRMCTFDFNETENLAGCCLFSGEADNREILPPNPSLHISTAPRISLKKFTRQKSIQRSRQVRCSYDSSFSVPLQLEAPSFHSHNVLSNQRLSLQLSNGIRKYQNGKSIQECFEMEADSLKIAQGRNQIKQSENELQAQRYHNRKSVDPPTSIKISNGFRTPQPEQVIIAKSRRKLQAPSLQFLNCSDLTNAANVMSTQHRQCNTPSNKKSIFETTKLLPIFETTKLLPTLKTLTESQMKLMKTKRYVKLSEIYMKKSVLTEFAEQGVSMEKLQESLVLMNYFNPSEDKKQEIEEYLEIANRQS